MYKARFWAIGFGVATLVACAPVDYPYIYISLEQVPGIRVDRTARVDQKELRGSSAMAVEYSLVRDSYTLHFSVVQKSLLPALTVTIEGSDHSLKFYRDMDTLAPNGAICASFDQATATRFDFGWAPECADPNLLKLIDFDVLNNSGETIARESIAFKLKENGFYTVMDAI